MSTTVKLRNVRMIYPHLGVPDKYGKYSVGVMVKKGSQAHQLLMQGLREEWAQGADKCGRSVFESNPTDARIIRASYLKVGGEVDAKGKPLPAWMDDYVVFGCQNTNPPCVVDGNLEPINACDAERIYNGADCHVSLDLSAFSNAESRNSGISRYLRSVVVLGGGEKIITQPGGFTDAVEEWS